MEPEPPGAGVDPRRSELESAPGPWPSGAGARAAQKSGGSATLIRTSVLQIVGNRCILYASQSWSIRSQPKNIY